MNEACKELELILNQWRLWTLDRLKEKSKPTCLSAQKDLKCKTENMFMKIYRSA